MDCMVDMEVLLDGVGMRLGSLRNNVRRLWSAGGCTLLLDRSPALHADPTHGRPAAPCACEECPHGDQRRVVVDSEQVGSTRARGDAGDTRKRRHFAYK